MTDRAILRELPRLRALVVGDICLDRWCTYDPSLSEPSAETSIPRIAVVRTETTPGAGGTIASNMASLGVGRVSVLGVLGDDGAGFELRKALARRGVRDHLLVECSGRQTFTYTKLLNQQTGVEDLPRVDYLPANPVPVNAQRVLLDRLLSAVDEHDITLIADQAETDVGGTVTQAVRALLGELAAAYPDKVFLADSRRRAHLFSGVSLKPNKREAEAASLEAFGDPVFSKLRETTRAPVLFVTAGPQGALVFDERGESVVPTQAVANPIDVCGAGDSFAAGAAATLFLTGSAVRAAQFGNLVASITIRKRGTGTASPEEILAANS